MRYKSLLLATIFLAAFAYAREPQAYQSGKVLQMDSARCVIEGKEAKSSSSETAGIDSDLTQGDTKTQRVVCQDYLLQAEQVIYRIRPRNSKHAALLPVGEWAQFRMKKNKMLLRMPGSDSPASDSPASNSKELEYIVVLMTPRGDSTADAHPVRLNHLQ
jgi:hypothetical protein